MWLICFICMCVIGSCLIFVKKFITQGCGSKKNALNK